MEWFKKHVDAAVVLGALFTVFIWLNGNISDVKHDLNDVKTELAVIKTVLVMKQIMPCELAKAPLENTKHVKEK